jgi:hypothetical protein
MQKRRALVGLVVLGLVTVLLVGLALFRSRTVPPAAAGRPVVATPAAQTSASAAPSATPSATPSSSPGAGTLVILGDGYAKDAAWVDQLGQDLGMTVVNLSEDGMGYRMTPPTCSVKPCRPFTGMAPRVAEARPDAVVVVGGEADGDYALSTFVDSTFSALKKAVPDARIVALSPLSSRSPRPHWLTLHARSIEKGAAAAGVTWVDLSAAAGKASAYDGGHLTNAAGAQVAAAIAAKLQ